MFIIFSESEFITAMEYVNSHDYHDDAPTIVMTFMCVMNEIRSQLRCQYPDITFNPINMLTETLEKLNKNKMPNKIIMWNNKNPFILIIGNSKYK